MRFREGSVDGSRGEYTEARDIEPLLSRYWVSTFFSSTGERPLFTAIHINLPCTVVSDRVHQFPQVGITK